MESGTPFPKKDTSLLTLSRHELMGNKDSGSESDEDTLVLMQLPSTLTAADLKSAHMIASPSQQVCLIAEDKGRTYALSRVETSNAYILVPPPSPSPDERPRKKTKTDRTLVSVPARLLQEGISGASFLELKSKTLSLADLYKELQDHVLDPYDTSKTWSGRTFSSLAAELQCSQKEVLSGLQRMHALGLPSPDGTLRYGLLSEEALQEAKLAIVATLTECEDFQDYAVSGVPATLCVEEVVNRVPSSETYQHMTEIIRHTLRALQSDPTATKDDLVQLDTRKVAVCVVHRLFSKQSDPWDENELLAQWQGDMPGVGDSYQVSLDMLSGVALRCEDSKKWKYFSEDKLPTDLEKRFEVLFEEREKWTLDDLKPYVQRLATSELSETDLLLRHTRFVTEDVDGAPTKLFVKR